MNGVSPDEINIWEQSQSFTKTKNMWIPPEIINPYHLESRSDKKTAFDEDPKKYDVFSLGLIALYCLDPKQFLDINNKFELRLIGSPKLLADYLDNLEADLPPPFYYLLRCMLSFCPYTRPSIKQLARDFHSIISRIELPTTIHSLSSEAISRLNNNGSFKEYLSRIINKEFTTEIDLYFRYE